MGSPRNARVDQDDSQQGYVLINPAARTESERSVDSLLGENPEADAPSTTQEGGELEEVDFGIPSRQHHEQPKQLKLWQVSIQMLQRLLDALSFPAGMGPHTLGQLGEPSPEWLLTLMLAVNVPVNDAFGEEVLVPLVTKKKPYSDATIKGALSQVASMGATILTSYYCVGRPLGSEFHHWLSQFKGGAKVGAEFGCSLVAGVGGGAMKWAFLGAFDKKRRDLFTVEHKDNPKKLLPIQNYGHHLVTFVADFAWKEAIRTGLMRAGYSLMTESCVFSPFMIAGIDMTRKTMLYLGHTPDPFSKLVHSGRKVAEQRPEPADFQDLESVMASPMPATDIDDLVKELESSDSNSSLASIHEAAHPTRSAASAPRFTKMQLAKVVGKSFLTCAASAGTVALANYLFIQSTFGKDKTEADRDPNLEGHDSFGYRMVADLARYVAYLGTSTVVSLATSRLSKWYSSKSARSGSVQDQTPDQSPRPNPAQKL